MSTQATPSVPRNPPPPVTGVTAYVQVRDAGEASAFYQRAFGATEVARASIPNSPKIIHLHLVINDGPLFLCDPFEEHGHPLETPQAFTLHLQVDDADRWFARAVEAGATSVLPVDVQFWGDRYGQVKDPFGILWSIGSKPR